MNIIAFIPARYNSTRFPGKPLASIAGKPMVQHVFENAVACPDISEAYIATDDERIIRLVKDFGGKAVMTGREHHSGTDRIAEAVQRLNLKPDDLVINIQGDQPLFKPDQMSRMLEPLINDNSIPVTTLKYRISEEKVIKDSNVVKVVTDNQGFALYFSRYPIPFYRDSEPEPLYYKHLGFYAYRADFLLKFTRLPAGRLETAEKLEQLRVLENGFRIIVVETSSDAMDVNVPEDIEKIKNLIK